MILSRHSSTFKGHTNKRKKPYKIHFTSVLQKTKLSILSVSSPKINHISYYEEKVCIYNTDKL